MPSDELNKAIQLIQAGQNEEALPILQGLIRVNQQDLEVWSWYVRSCRTPEKRLEALELCLRFNPGNVQITEAIQKLREKLAPPPPVIPLNPVLVSQAENQISPYDFDEDPSEPEPVWETNVPAPWESRTPEPTTSFPLTYGAPQGPDIQKFASVDTTVDDIEDASGRPLMWYEVWWIAITQPKLPAYDALLRDPMRSWGRVFWWTFSSSLITWLIFFVQVLLTPRWINQLNEMRGATNIAVFMLLGVIVFVVFGGVVNIVALMLNAGFYHVLAKMFGGIGTFARIVYVRAAYNAPFSIASALVSLLISPIFCLNVIVPVLITIYYFRLEVLSIQAAHRLNGGRSTIVVLLPTLVLCLSACVLFILMDSLLGQAAPDLEQFLRQQAR